MCEFSVNILLTVQFGDSAAKRGPLDKADVSAESVAAQSTGAAASADPGAAVAPLHAPGAEQQRQQCRDVRNPRRQSGEISMHEFWFGVINSCQFQNKNQLQITHLLVPKQNGTPDSCTTMNEEEIFDFQDNHDLITFGWIHVKNIIWFMGN
jgi:hypothetical protein